MEKDALNDTFESNSFPAFLREMEGKIPEFKEKSLQDNGMISFPSAFLIELVNSIKKALVSIININSLTLERFEDEKFRKFAYKSVGEDIKKVDSVLNSFLNYIHISTPLLKRDTIHAVLEEILEANEKVIRDKDINIIKKYEIDLPETFLHDEQVKFIMNSILQYAILTIPLKGSITFVTKSIYLQLEGSDSKAVSSGERKYVEILITLTERGDPVKFPQQGHPGLRASHKEGVHHLILLLIKELINKYEGLIGFKVDEEELRVIISLRLPADRREVIYYEHMNL